MVSESTLAPVYGTEDQRFREPLRELQRTCRELGLAVVPQSLRMLVIRLVQQSAGTEHSIDVYLLISSLDYHGGWQML